MFGLREHSVPNHLTVPAVALTHNPSARQAFWASPLGSRLADWPGRNGFVILRTAHSLSVTLHLLSQGRSYLPLQAGVCMPEEDSHLSDQTRPQAYCHGRFASGTVGGEQIAKDREAAPQQRPEEGNSGADHSIVVLLRQ